MSTRNETHMMRAVQVSLVGNLILFLVKAVTLVFVDSLAVATDLGISTVSLLVSVMLFYSIRMANRPADLIHNYGYGKVEHVCEAMEGIVIIGIAGAMSFQAVMGIMHPGHMTHLWLGLSTSALGIIINCIGGAYILAIARKTASPAIRSEGIHYFLEASISFTITCSFLLVMFLESRGFGGKAFIVDPIATLVVSAVIFIPSAGLAKHAFFNLLDSSIEESGQMEVVKRLGLHHTLYCEYKDLKTRSSGRKKFIELKLVLPESLPLADACTVADTLEKDISNNIPQSEVRISVEPCAKDCHHVKKGHACPYATVKRR